MKNMSDNIKSYLLIIMILVSTGPISADSAVEAGIDSLFKSDQVLILELRSDFSAIQIDRADSPEEHEGELIYRSPDGEKISFSVNVMARGNFRRNPENCTFPPLRLNFKKSEVNNTIFENQDKLKLVTTCQFEEEVLEEYAIYRMYNLVSESSFKVRLARITYFDTGKGKKLFERYSFFIEDKDHLAERIGAFVDERILAPHKLLNDNFKYLPVFQYMIGQKDWFITTSHNIVIMQPKDTTLAPYAVPYDFDFSALVDAEYSMAEGVPNSIGTNRRVYRGVCLTRAEFDEIFEFYRRLRPEFESVINSMDLISKSGRNWMINYIGYFYKVIEKDELIKQEFVDKCLTKRDLGIIEK
jgi:hypothetical protein